MKPILIILSVLSFATVAQPQSNVPPAGPGTASFRWIEANIIQPKCIECHQALSSYEALHAHLSPGHPENSIFFTAMGNGQYCQMPQSLNNAPIKCVDQRGLRAVYWWIKAGAPNN